MELTPINILLIALFAPCIFIVLFMFLLAPLFRKVIDRGRPTEKQAKEESRRFREAIKEKRRNLVQRSSPSGPSKEEIDQYREETNTLAKRHRLYQREQIKKLLKISSEDTGLTSVIAAMKVSEGTAATLFYLASLLLMPVLSLFINAANVVLGFPWQQPVVLIMLLATPILGLFLALRGYKIYKKKLVVVFCIVSNGIYFFAMSNVVISLLK